MYDYGAEEQAPRQHSGRALGGFVIGLLLGLGVGFWVGRGPDLNLDTATPNLEMVLAVVIPLVILVLVMTRLRERTVREPLPSSQVRSIMLVLVGLIFAIGMTLALFFAMAR
jgi:hypothetical protein